MSYTTDPDPDTCVPGDGPIPTAWLFLGEAPGAMEDRFKLPFVGPAGDHLWELASRIHITREQVYVDNVYPYYRPGNPTPTPTEIRAQHEHINAIISLVNPSYIVLLGATAISALAPQTTLKSHHGIPIKSDSRILIPMYHPAASLHNPALASTMQKDWDDLPARLQQLLNVTPSTLDYQIDAHTVSIHNIDALALDTETDPDGTLICFSTATRRLDGTTATTVYIGNHIKHIVANTLVMHNAKFDLQVLRRAGIVVSYQRLIDTMITAWNQGEDSLSLKALAARYCGISMTPLKQLLEAAQHTTNLAWLSGAEPVNKTETAQLGRWQANPLSINPRTKLYGRLQEQLGPLPLVGVRELPDLYSYNAKDSVATLSLAEYQEPLITPQQRRVLDIEIQCLPTLAEMEYQGIGVDPSWLSGHSEDLINLRDLSLADFPPGINPNSSTQLIPWLYENKHIRFRTKSGAPSTDKAALEALNNPQSRTVLRYRHIVDQLEVVESLLGCYRQSPDGRIHTQFQQVRVHEETGGGGDGDGEGATATGRLSSRNPNLQNITHDLRRAFVAPPSHALVSVDYSQIEQRLMAYYADDRSMADGFRRGESPYITVGNLVFNKQITRDSDEYKLAKILVLGTNYRLTDWGFSIRSGLPIAEAAAIISKYLAMFPGIQRYMDHCWHLLARQGYVETFHGRRRYLSQSDGDRAWRQAVNLPITGTAAEIMKIALGAVQHKYPRLTVHDEIVAEVPLDLTNQVARDIIEVMEAAWPADIGRFVPIACHATIGNNWAQMHPLELT